MLVLMTGILAWTALRFGGTIERDFVLSALTCGLALAYSQTIGPGVRAPNLPAAVRSLSVALLALVIVQLIPVPMGLLNVIGPHQADVHRAWAQFDGDSSWPRLTIAPYETERHLLRLLCYYAVFLVARDLSSSRREKTWRLAWPILAAAGVEAIIGLLQYDPARSRMMTGTFANRNQLAGFLALSLPFARGWAMSRESSADGLGQKLIAWLWTGLLVAAIAASGSRGGIAAAVGGVLIGALCGRRKVRLKRWTTLIGAGAAVAGAIAVFLAFESKPAVSDAGGISIGSRLQVWSETMALIRAYPWFGCGLGAFEPGLVEFRRSLLSYSVEFAHNDYLQAAAELGIPGMLIWVSLLGALVYHTGIGARRHEEEEARLVGSACLGALCAVLLQSAVDFDFYTPAIVLAFCWAAGLGCGLALDRKTRVYSN